MSESRRCDRCAGFIYGSSYTTVNGYIMHDDCAKEWAALLKEDSDAE